MRINPMRWDLKWYVAGATNQLIQHGPHETNKVVVLRSPSIFSTWVEIYQHRRISTGPRISKKVATIQFDR